MEELAHGALLARARQAIRDADLARRHGFVSDLIGLIIEATGLHAEVGEVCLVGGGRERPGAPAPATVHAEVVGFREGRTLLMPLGELHGIGPGTRVRATGAPFRVLVGDELLGRIVDGLGRPVDGKPAPAGTPRSTIAAPPEALSRPRISERLWACARSTASCHAGAGSGSVSSPAPVWGSPRCWG
jgi:flagellum-specific ATP synthase